jgi:hypothetical protein
MLILIIQLSNYNIYYHKLYLLRTFFSFYNYLLIKTADLLPNIKSS